MPATREHRPADFYSEGAGFSSSAPVHLAPESHEPDPVGWVVWIALAILAGWGIEAAIVNLFS